MNPAPATLLRIFLTGALAIAWALLAHWGSIGNADADLAAGIALAPLLAAPLLLLWRNGRRGLAGLATLGLTGLLAIFWQTLRQNVAWLYYLQHLGINLALAALFGRTLFGGREALISHFSRLAHDGPLTPARARYTRQVTWAWTAFFLANAALSTALFLFAPADVWSVFANLLPGPLIAAMFALEYLVRCRVLPPADRPGIMQAIRGYRAGMRARGKPLADPP